MAIPPSGQPVPPRADHGGPDPGLFVPMRALAIAAGVLLLALLFGAWGLWRVIVPAPGDLRGELERSQGQVEQLQQQLANEQQKTATLSRSDQISRDANRELQGALAVRDEEIAGLRADVAFYERLVGSTAQRRGLSVHAIRMQPQSERAWHFNVTLTRNLDREVVSAGQVSLSIEGSRDGRLETLEWEDLRQQPGAPGLDFSFRYFQQVRGDVFLPEGFEPVRVNVQLDPKSGAPVEQSFTWAEATGAQDNGGSPRAEGPAGE